MQKTETVPTFAPFPTELATRFYDLVQDAWREWMDAWPSWPPKAEGKECGCDPCACEEPCDTGCNDDCHCRCCVTDADLVVHARVGERRVVPIVLENDSRRERRVRVELSEFSGRRAEDRTLAKGEVFPQEFTLGPCESRPLTLLVDVGAKPGTPAKPATPPKRGVAAEAVAAAIPAPRMTDVEDCRILYADLRVEGCENRSTRIALAVLPRDCGAHHVGCRCGCC